MKIIISPAKKMIHNTDILACEGLPQFIEKTQVLMEYMQSLTYQQCKEI